MSRVCWLNNGVVGEVKYGAGGCWFWFFLIIMSCPLMQFTVVPVSAFRVVILMDLFNTVCLYEINLGGTKVLSVHFNKIFLL